MKKRIAYGLALVFVSGLLIAREWLTHRELNTRKEEIHSQIKEGFENASTYERLNELSASTLVFERYLEPVLLTSNKLLWPFSRERILLEWRRSVNEWVMDGVYRRRTELRSQTDASWEKIKQEKTPSMARLLEALELRASLFSGNDLKDFVKEETTAISKQTLETDQATLDEIRAQGREILKTLKVKLKRLDFKGFSNYLTSGKYHSEVEAPLLGLVFKLRQEATRQATWNEFQKELLKTLGAKKPFIAKNTQKKVQEISRAEEEKKFQALFESVAESIKREDEGHTSQLGSQPPSSTLTPAPQEESVELSPEQSPDYLE